MKFLITLSLSLITTTASADMYQDASNAKMPEARDRLSGGGHAISIKDYGAKGDARQYYDGVISAGSTNFTSALANFTKADVGKKIQIDGGAGLAVTPTGYTVHPTTPPFATTIAGFTNAHAVTLAAAPPATTPHSWAGVARTATSRTAGNYQPGDVLTVAGGSGTAAQLTVTATTVTAATIVAGGTGGIDPGTGSPNGTGCVISGTTGTGSKAYFTATLTGGAITAIAPVGWAPGYYYANPTNLGVEPIASAPGYSCAPTGATIALTMGVYTTHTTTPGDYSVVPANPVATSAGSLSGATGATFNISYNQSGFFVYGTDDSPALKAGIEAAQAAFAAGKPSDVFIPAGNYLIDATPTPLMSSVNNGGPVGIVGEGSSKSNLIVGANYVGDVFAWSEAWIGNDLPHAGTVSNLASWKAGAKVVGISIAGNRTAAAKQNALVFYDRTDQLFLDDVDIGTLNGRCFYVGKAKITTEGYMRESHISRLRCFGVGSDGYPNIELISEGAGDRTNTNSFSQIDIYAPRSTGFWFHTFGGGLTVDRMRIEGLELGSFPADLLKIGDDGLGQVASIQFNDLALITMYPNQAAMRITAPNSNVAPYFIRVSNGLIGGGAPEGYGVVVEAGRNLYFNFSDIRSFNTNFTTGPSAWSIFLDGDGAEQNWSYQLAYPSAVSTPMRKVGGWPDFNPAVGGPTLSMAMPDNTTKGGGVRGVNAIDLQGMRTSPFQVASGFGAVIGGGSSNRNDGLGSVIAGGSNNLITGAPGSTGSTISGGHHNTAGGSGTVITGGAFANDRNAVGGMYYAPFGCQPYQLSGSCQRSWHVFSAFPNTAAAVRLTSDHAAPNALNCLPIPSGVAYQVVVRASAHDWNSNNVASWDAIQGLLYRVASGPSLTTYLGGAGGAPTQSTGPLGTLAVAADVSNTCLALTYTPPAGNTDYIHIVASVDVVEAQ